MNALVAGGIARQRLGEARQASLLGITRRGWLVQLEVGWVIFLSQEAARGPLTLNLEAGAALPAAAPGLAGEVTGDALAFPAAGLRMDFSQAATWQAPAARQDILPGAQRRACLVEVARLCLAGRPASPIGALLAPLLGLEENAAYDPALLEKVRAVQDALAGVTIEVVTTRLAPLLGLGCGLTPSGDDLAIGLLLALHRWGACLGWKGDLDALGEAVACLAAQRTTTLAANLIACAALGEADERLLTALDGLMTGEPALAACAAALADWGSSSGVDALVGMALTL